MSKFPAGALLLALLALQGAWADRGLRQSHGSRRGSFPAPLFPICKFKGIPGAGRWRGCSIKVPAKSTGCTVVFRGGVPRASCATIPGKGFFGDFITVPLPDTPSVVSCSITPGGKDKIPRIDCSPNIPPIPKIPGTAGTGPIVVGRTLIPPPGSGSCVATNLQAGQTPSVTCSPAGDGQTPFAPGVTIELPTGEFGRCTFGADDNGQVVAGCVGIPLTAPDPLPPLDTGGVPVPPEDTLPPLDTGGVPVPPEDPPAIPDPPVIPLPPPKGKKPIISGNTLIPPPGSASCTISRSAAGAPPTATCDPPANADGATFPPGFTFEFSPGSGRCTLQAREGGDPLIQCVGIPPEQP